MLRQQLRESEGAFPDYSPNTKTRVLYFLIKLYIFAKCYFHIRNLVIKEAHTESDSEGEDACLVGGDYWISTVWQLPLERVRRPMALQKEVFKKLSNL